MSDFENDSECLEIHLGSRLRDSSSSGDNDELDEEYRLLLPSPIPAEIITQKSIYRPPSPKNEVPEYTLSTVSSSCTVSTAKKINNNMQAVVGSKPQMESIVRVHLKIANDLIKVQHELFSYSGKLSLTYLDALEKFRINLDCFGSSLENLRSEKTVAMSSRVSDKAIINLKNSIENFTTLLSNLYAFLISEYLLILTETVRTKRSKATLIVMKTLDLIEKLGDVNDILKKIHIRTLKKIDDPNFSHPVSVHFTNDEIISELKILFPEMDKNRRRRKRIRTKKTITTVSEQKGSSDEKSAKNYPGLISPKQGSKIFQTTENKQGYELRKSQVSYGKSESMKQSSISKNDVSIEEKNSSIENSSKKKKRNRYRKRKGPLKIEKIEANSLKVSTEVYKAYNTRGDEKRNMENANKNPQHSETKMIVNSSSESNRTKEKKLVSIEANSLKKGTEVYKGSNTSGGRKANMEIDGKIPQHSETEKVVVSEAKSNIGHEKNSHINESGCQVKSEDTKLLKYYSRYNSGQHSRNEDVVAAIKNKTDEEKIICNFDEIATQFSNIYRYPNAITNSILKLLEYSNMKVISLLNVMQYSVANFEIKNSVAAFETLKDSFKIFHYIVTFNDLLLKVSSGRTLVEITEYFIPTSRICQAHLYAYIITQSAELMMSLKSQSGVTEAEVLYPELIKLLDLFGTLEEINQKLEGRNDNIYIELAQQVCSIIPVTYISASNLDIVGNIESLRKSTEKLIIKRTEFIIHHLKLPTPTRTPKYTEFDHLHFDVEKIEILVELQNKIYNSDQNQLTDFYSLFENMNKFCVMLKTLEEFKKRKFEVGSFVHAFLHNLDNILSLHTLRILISQFYSFIFYILSIYILKLHELACKNDAKLYRRQLLNLMTFVCPLEQIPKKLRFRNDDFFIKYTKESLRMKGIVICMSSKQLCKNISNIVKINRGFFVKCAEGYIYSPTSFGTQISKLEGEIFVEDGLFNICVEGSETEKLINFETLANDILQSKIRAIKRTSSLKRKQHQSNGGTINLDSSINIIKGVLKPETTNNKKSNDSEKKGNSSKNIVEEKTSKSVAESISIREQFSEIKRKESETFINFMEANMKTTNVLNVLQYSMDTFEMKYSKSAIEILKLLEYSNMKVISLLNIMQYSVTNFEMNNSVAVFETLKDSFKILHYIITFNDLLLKVSSGRTLVEITDYFIPTSRICQAHLYAYIITQSAELMMSLKSQSGVTEAEVLYPELLKLLDLFGTLEEINQKLEGRNDNIYIELAQQVCSIIPVSYISASNLDIVGNIESLRKSTEKLIIKRTEFIIHHLKLPTTTRTPKYTEFDHLHFDVKKIELLVELQNKIYNSDQNQLSDFYSLFENMNKFCIMLKTLEEFKKRKFEVGSFVHAFLNNLDNILSLYTLRILISQFYSFIFYILSIYILKLHELACKNDAKLYRRQLLNLMTFVCPLEQIPKRLRFRNDDFFIKYTKESLRMKGIVICMSSKQLCKNISNIVKINRGFFEKCAERYIYSPTSFATQISKLEGEIFVEDGLFNICIEESETEKLINFETLANDILQSKISSIKHTSSLKRKQHQSNGSTTNLDSSINRSKGVLKPETTNKKKSNDSEKKGNSSKNIVEEKTSKSVAESISITEQFSEMKRKESETLITSMEANMKAINVLNILQYSMDTFEMKYSKSAIEILKDCINILKSIFNYNNLLLSSCSPESLKRMEVCYIPISQLFQSHCYAYVAYILCQFIKTLRNRFIHEESEILLFQLNEIIEEMGTTEDIYNKLKYRDVQLYIELAQKVCSIIPAICTLPSNIEILKEWSQIKNSLESHRDSFEFKMKNVVQNRNEGLEVVINTILPRKYYDIENLQLDLSKIEILSTLQINTYHLIMDSSKVNSVYENMKNFSVILKTLEKQDESEPNIGSSVHDLSTNSNRVEVASLVNEISANLNKVLTRHILRIFVSQFYSFFLFIFLETFHKVTSDCFQMNLFKLLISLCPLEKIPEKLQFRNDKVYLKYIKVLCNIEGVAVDKSSEKILNEALGVFKANKAHFEDVSVELSTQLDEFEKNILWTKEELNTSLEVDKSFEFSENKLNNDLNVLPKKHTKQNLCNAKVESSVTGSISRREVNFEVVQYLQKSFKSEVRDIIIQIMNNQLGADIALNSVMRKIEYSIFKAITTINILQYSFDTFEKKYSFAAFVSVLDCLVLLHSFGKCTKLLSVSSSCKLQEIEKYYAPILEICQAYFYAYILSSCCEFIRRFKSDTNQIENEIYSKILNMVKAFGTHEEIYENLKNRNDNYYIEIVKQSCSVIPSTLLLPSNDYILRNIPYLTDIQEFEFIISENPGMNTMKCKLKRFSRGCSEFECTKLDLKKITLLTELQHDIHFHDRFPTDFSLVFQNVINFFVNLRSFEDDEIKLSGSGNFVDYFLEKLDIILSFHILRILVAQFYSFIFSACLDFIKKLPELVSKNKVIFYHTKLIHLFSSNGPIDNIFKKIQFRNDCFYSKYIGDILKMKVILVGKSLEEIQSEVFDTVNQIHTEYNSNNCSVRVFNSFNLRSERYKLPQLNNFKVFVKSLNVSQLSLVRDDAFKRISKNNHHLRRESQNIYLSFQDYNEVFKYVILNFADIIFALDKIYDSFYISIFLPKFPKSECKYINYNNQKRIFEHHGEHFSMTFECSVPENEQFLFWNNLLQFAQEQVPDKILIKVSSETRKTFDNFMKNFNSYICIDTNFQERKNNLHALFIELEDEERKVVQFHPFSGLMLYVISREIDQLIRSQHFSNFFEIPILFKEIFLCILKRIRELSEIYCVFLKFLDYCREKTIVHDVSLIQTYKKFVMERMESVDYNFTLHRAGQYYTLGEILVFLICNESVEPLIMSWNSKFSHSFLSRFLSCFDIVIFESSIPFRVFERIHSLIVSYSAEYNIDKVELFLQKISHKHSCLLEYFNTICN